MTTLANSFIAEAERTAAERHGSDPAWFAHMRREGLERFDRLGFPTTRDEEWRFTSVMPIAESRFVLPHNGASSVTREHLGPFEWTGDRAATLVFVNGRYAASISNATGLPSGVRVESLARALAATSATPLGGVEAYLTRIATSEQHAFTALNTAFLGDGAFVSIPPDMAVRAPIHLIFVSTRAATPTMSHPRVLVVMGANSQATLVESYGAVDGDRYFTNAVTEVVAGQNSSLQHYKVQRETPLSFHVGALYVRAARDATVACHSIALGGALVRNEVLAILDGEGAGCTLNGMYLSDGTRLVDNHTTIDHAKPHCASREVYKGILAGRARAVFNGKIIVRPDAQKTDAKQTSKALLLSEHAQINTKPQLEIFANDVKCTHGAAVGQMDDEAIFYLRARGLGEHEARHMLIRAFAGDVLNQMPLEPLRARVDDELVRSLPGWRT
jgi:Fe-S cluster assembly protein SufD